MIDELRLNPKFLGTDGIIGRYDYCLNLIFLGMINLFFSLPLNIYLFTNLGTLEDLFNLNKVWLDAPWILKIWVLLGGILCSYILIINSNKRLNDINGKIQKDMNAIFAGLFVLNAFCIIYPCPIAFLLTIVNTIAILYLIFKKGELTGKYPYDYRKEFNWGAYFGTWLWGLWNKSYKTLWILLLGITPWGALYSLYLGMKGNEWSAKNRNWQNIEEFNKSQETQTIVFVLLNVLVFPIIYFTIIFALMLSFITTTINETKNSPEHASQTLEKLDNTLTNLSSMYFEKHEITEHENKYYALPEDWKRYSFSEKKDILDIAASVSASERKKLNSTNHYNKTSELSRTKIYNIENNELLGEYYMDETLLYSENTTTKNLLKSAMKAYKFYKPSK